MLRINWKYHINAAQLCFVKVALLFAVFSFSGHYTNLPYHFHDFVKIELVESTNNNELSDLVDYSEINEETKAVNSNTFVSNDFSQVLFYFNQSQNANFKARYKQSLSFQCASIKLPNKILLSSSNDEVSPIPIG